MCSSYAYIIILSTFVYVTLSHLRDTLGIHISGKSLMPMLQLLQLLHVNVYVCYMWEIFLQYVIHICTRVERYQKIQNDTVLL